MSAKIKIKRLVIAASLTATAITLLSLNKGATAMSQKPVFPQKVEIALGQSGENLEKKYGSLVNANRKNVGLNFLTIDANHHGSSVTAVVKTGSLITSIPSAMSIMATEDRDRKVGFTDLLITAEVNRDDFVPHPVAHQYVLNLIQSLRKTGWRYSLYATDPRLKGQAAFNQFKQSNLDPDYQLSFEQWMALPRPLTWEFYADHTYLTLTVDRDISHLDPAKPGAYFISLTFQPREEAERLQVDEKDRDHWRDTWVKRNLAYRAERNIEEAKLRTQGIAIDTDYKDPPLPPPPAGQQNPVIPDALK